MHASLPDDRVLWALGSKMKHTNSPLQPAVWCVPRVWGGGKLRFGSRASLFCAEPNIVCARAKQRTREPLDTRGLIASLRALKLTT